jgi:ATP-dependent metalloprotease
MVNKKPRPSVIFGLSAAHGEINPLPPSHPSFPQMDGFHSSEGIVVIGATNFPEVLDKALTRPGRFDRHVVVPKPDVKGRTQILELHTRKVPKASDVDLKIVARGTPGFSGADLMNLVNIAAIKASNDDRKAVGMEEFEFAKDRILMGSERKSALVSEENRRLTAYHEGGHALVATFTEGADPVHKATVVPRGMALGMVMQLPDKDETSWSYKQMMASIDVAMGGRAAEEVIFGHDNVTSGASSDFEQATKIAFDMVDKFGMSDKTGFVAFKDNLSRSGGGASAISDARRKVIDAEVKKIVDESYERAKATVEAHKDKLHLLAQELIDKETLTGKQVRLILGVKESKE